MRQNPTLAPHLWWVLLLCTPATLLARASPIPENITAATASAGTAKDPSCSPPAALPTAQPCPGLAVTWPETEVPLNGRINLSCTACSHFPHFSILYWLGNGSFIEHLPGRLWEGAIRREHRSTSTQLWRALVLEELSPALRSTNFSCVFVDPEQVAQHHGVLAQLWAQPRTILFPTQEALPSRASPGPQLPTTAGLGTSRGPAQHDPDLEGQ